MRKYLSFLCGLVLAVDAHAGILISYAPQSFSTPAYVQGNAAHAASGSTLAVTLGSPQGAGDLNVIAIGWATPADTISSVVSSNGNTYTLACTASTATSDGVEAIYYAPNIKSGSETITVTFSGSVTFPDLRAAEYSGVATANPLDKCTGQSSTSSGQSSATSFATPSVSTTRPNELLVGADYISGTFTGAGSGYSERLLSPGSNLLEDQNVSSVGSYTASASQTPSGWWIINLVTFKAAISPPYVPPSGGGTSLLNYLTNLPTGSTNRILSGQFSDIYDSGATTPFASFTSGSTSPSNANINGYVPAILGVAVQGGYNGGSQTQQGATGANNVAALANAWQAAGGIVEVTAWFNNPACSTSSGASCATSTTGDAGTNLNSPITGAGGSVLTVGSNTYNNWIANLNNIATLLGQINGPVIFRPFVEANGNWFWWGYGGATIGGGSGITASQFQQLWALTYNYLVVTKGLTNLLFEYNVNDNYPGPSNGVSYTAGYPGAAYAQLVSFDSYSDTPGTLASGSNGSYSALVGTGKPVLIGELGNGTSSAPDGYSYATMLQDIKTNTPNVVGLTIWCQTWALAHDNTTAQQTAFMTDPWIITRGEVPPLNPSSAPAPAASVGYNTLTFNSTSIGNVTGTWQDFNFLGSGSNSSTYSQQTNGSITISGGTPGNGFNAQLSTAVYNSGCTSSWCGVAFGGGFFATATFTITGTPSNSNGWPSFWMNDVERMVDAAVGSDTSPYNIIYPGQSSGQDLWSELDVFEALNTNITTWVGTIHAWTGAGAVSGSQHNYQAQSTNPVTVPPMSSPTTIGVLYVPATATTNGSVTWYLSNTTSEGTQSWQQYNTTNLPAYSCTTGCNNAFSVIDQRHMALLLGNSYSASNSSSFNITSVQVWQASTSGNLIH